MDETGGKHTHMRNNKWYEVESVEDVLANILSRLPVKSVLVSKSVSKLWYGLICSPAFVDLQLCQSRKNPIYMFCPYMDILVNLYLMEMKNDAKINDIITLPSCLNLFPISMICSFDGLTCCINYPWKLDRGMPDVVANSLEIRICNPATREVQLLPEGSSSEELPSIGVAFGPKINEYKVYRIFCAKYGSEAKHYECEVYSSYIGYWEGIGSVPHRPMHTCHCSLGSNHVFVNGKVHWFIVSKEYPGIPGSILTVDLEENFQTISLPRTVTEHSYLIELEGCLSLVVVADGNEFVDIWVLQDSSESKWVKKYSDWVPFSTVECVEFVSAHKSDLLFITVHGCFVYNLNFRTWKELKDFTDLERHYPVCFTYTESLLSCSGRMDPETDEEDSEGESDNSSS